MMYYTTELLSPNFRLKIACVEEISIKQVTWKQSPSSFSNSNYVTAPITLYYALFFFASVVTQKSAKVYSQQPILFSTLESI